MSTANNRRGRNQYRSFEELGVTENQLKYIAEHYGKRPLVLLAQECDLPVENAQMVKNRLRRDGKLTEGPGHNYRETMKAHGYDAPPPVGLGPGGRKPVVMTEKRSVQGDPSCVHHRMCEPVNNGYEMQECRFCGDIKVVRIYW